MAHLISLKTFTDKRGNLTVIEKSIPFAIKRIFYIYGVDDSVRGGHRHHKTIQAAICLQGSCVIENNNGIKEEKFEKALKQFELFSAKAGSIPSTIRGVSSARKHESSKV